MTSDSMVWSEDEAIFLRKVLSFNESESQASTANEQQKSSSAEAVKPSISEFKILVVGAKGCGKSSILSRFPKGDPAPLPKGLEDEVERGCRYQIPIEGQYHTVDALEFSSKLLSSDPHLSSAIDATEAAVLVYDVRSRESLRIARGVYELVRDTVGTTDYGLLLVGTKSDCEQNEREVTWAEGKAAATAFEGETVFTEASAVTGQNLAWLFPHLGKEILKIQRVKWKRWTDYLASQADAEKKTEPAGQTSGWRKWFCPLSQRKPAKKPTPAPDYL